MIFLDIGKDNNKGALMFEYVSEKEGISSVFIRLPITENIFLVIYTTRDYVVLFVVKLEFFAIQSDYLRLHS